MEKIFSKYVINDLGHCESILEFYLVKNVTINNDI